MASICCCYPTLKYIKAYFLGILDLHDSEMSAQDMGNGSGVETGNLKENVTTSFPEKITLAENGPCKSFRV